MSSVASTGRLTDPKQLCALLDVPFTPAQLAAATAPLEPGVIVAGAGSGKTTVMAARVVWLVGTGAVRPAEILGLTFTNKAAAELAARVRRCLDRAQLPGVDAEADLEPTVSTYHAFAGRLVQEHGLRLGVEPGSRLLADATRYQLAARVLRRARGPIRALSKPISMLVEDVVALDGELAEHLVAPAALRAFDLELRDRLAAISRPASEVSAAAEAVHKRLELLTVVEAYRAEKRDRDLIDFGDQVAYAAELAGTCPDVAAAERGRYRVVLLDEYQDTSVAQRLMLSGLFGQGHPVTAVGDPCQAIYGWRGASVRNLDDFPQHFPQVDGGPAARYSLVENRRSGSRLLDLANALSARLREVHTVEPLLPCADKEATGDTVCALLPTYDEEMGWVADQVEAAVSGGTAPGEVAVLVRARSDFPALFDTLSARGLPVEVVGLGGLLALPEVADVVSVLEVLDDATANPALVRLLTGPRWRVGPRDLALLGRRARDLVADPSKRGRTDDRLEQVAADDRLDAALREAVAGVDPAEVVSLSEAVADPGPLPYSAEARSRFAAFAAELRELRRSVDEPLLDLVSRVITLTGLDVELAASPAAVRAGRQANLAAFLDHAARFSDLDGESSVTAFLAFLRAADEWERGLDTTAPSGSDAVKLLTVHRSKGLEWDVVVIPNLTAKVFPSSRGRARWTSNGQVLPYPLRGDFDGARGLPDVGGWDAKGLKTFSEETKAHDELEERRLGYVALTRARTRLVASSHWWGPRQKLPRGPSAFLLEVRDHCAAGQGVIDVWAEQPPEDSNPHLAAGRKAVPWPVELDPVARAAREDAAALVLADLTDQPGDRSAADLPSQPALTAEERAQVAAWDRDADALLAELRTARRSATSVNLPAALSTSQLQRLAADPYALARELARPMPRRPLGAARRGTRFHAWVQTVFGEQPLLGPDELPGAGDAHLTEDGDLAELQQAFLRTPWATRSPYAVEAPFALVLGGHVVRGRIDAVYADGDSFEVVDWKTNAAETADPLQLAVYRLAWSEITGVAPTQVRAAFVYVRTGRVVRPGDLPDRAELERLIAGRSQ